MNPCVRCGKPSSDHHHGRPENLNMGKGSGGTQHDDSHFVMLDLCRGCHDRAHNKTTIFAENSPGEISWHDMDGPASGVRSLKLAIDETDEWLATQWGEAQSLGRKAILVQAEVATKFRTRYGGFDHWWVRVADIIREVTGLTVSVGLVYDRAALGMALVAWDGDGESFLEEFGVKGAAAIGRAVESGADGKAVIAHASELREDETRTATARGIKQAYLGLVEEEHAVHLCKCGATWE